VADLAPDTQLRASPPFYVLFGNQLDALPVNYERFLMNGLRQSFDLPGVPIRISKKRAAPLLLRKKRGGDSGRPPAQSHKPGRHFEIRIIPKMFHVKHFCPVEAQNLTRASTRICFILVGSRKFFVRFHASG
jgi:hypothetical protein